MSHLIKIYAVCMAHNEPPHQDPCCLQIQLFLPLVLKEFKKDTLQMRLLTYVQMTNSSHA